MVQSYRYLGIVLYEHLNFGTCKQALADSAGHALPSIIGKFKSLKHVRYDTFTKLLNSGVRPIMEYGCGSWGYEFDSVQYRAIRYYLGVHKYAPLLGLVGDMGWPETKYYFTIGLLRYWNRIIDMPDDRLTKILFLEDYQNKCNNWSNEICKLLHGINCCHPFDNEEKIDIKSRLRTFTIKTLSKMGKEQE